MTTRKISQHLYLSNFQPNRIGWIYFSIAAIFFLFYTPVLADKSRTNIEQDRLSAADPYALIDAVNAVRLSHGLAPYAASSILMNAAQQHAQYMSTAGVTHYGADGSRPYQRGLAAGYPLAGDLSLGGFYSENIIAGNKMTVTEAVQAWQGDAPHLNTMLSTNLTEIGAGVVIVSDYVYFVIDCARPTGSGQTTVIKTIVPGEITSIPVDLSSIPETPVPGPIVVNTLVPVTPDGDGRIWHVVKPGETLWLIAVSYNTKVAEIRKLNNLSETQAIIPGQKLLVRQDVIASPIPITSTSFPKNTIQPEITIEVLKTVVPAASPTVIPVTQTPIQNSADPKFSMIILGVIILSAVVLSLVFIKILKTED